MSGLGEDLNIVLLGKTGYGKSATGNTLLESIHPFQESCNQNSQTKLLTEFVLKSDQYNLHVFDTPGLMDADSEKPLHAQTKEICGIMDNLMDICRQRKQEVTAFLLVHNVINKFSAEDSKTVQTLETIFSAPEFRKRCILVITREDNLEIDFDYWLRNQTGPFKKIVDSCECRVVLVCNRDIDNMRTLSRQRLMDGIQNLKRSANGYSFTEYNKHKQERYRLILEQEIPCIETEYKEKINRIKKANLTVKNQEQREQVLTDIGILRAKIEEKDNKTNLLKNYLELLDLEKQAVPEVKNCIIL